MLYEPMSLYPLLFIERYQGRRKLALKSMDYTVVRAKLMSVS